MAKWGVWGTLCAIFLLGSLPMSAQARPRSRNGALQIVSSVAGASVRIDGAEIGSTPLRNSLLLRVGSHLLEVQKTGVGTMSQKVTIMAGNKVTIQVRLERDEPPLLALEPLPAAPLEPQLILLPQGPLVTPLAAPGSMMPPTMATLPAAATGEQEPPLQAQTTLDAGPAWYEHWWVWAAVSVAVAGAGVATYEVLHARSQPDARLVLTPQQGAGFRF